MKSFQTDYNFGIEQENQLLIKIQKYFIDDNIKKETSKYSKYDFNGIKYHYELKSRTNSYEKFNTTLIPFDKINENLNICFLFKFTNGLYYIYYDKEKFNNYDLKKFKRHQRADFDDKEKLYFHIPIIDLTQIF
jgi:hypothetical protein